MTYSKHRSDEELMKAFAAGDDRAFEEIVCRYEKRLLNFFYRLCWDYHLSEDLVQEVFKRLVAARGRFDGMKGRFSTYLFIMARNLWVDEVRKRGRRVSTVSMEEMEDSHEGGWLVGPADMDPAVIAERREMLGMIKRVLDELPEEKRVIFALNQYNGLSVREIARIMDMPPSVVKSRLYATIRRLRNVLKGGGRDAED